MPTSTANPPSEDIKDMIEDSSSGLSHVFGTDLFIASMPDTPDNCVCIYDTGGSPMGPFSYEAPNVQINVRNNAYQAGYDIARDLKYYLHHKENETWNSTRYILIDLRSDILFLGQDENNRYEWSMNFRIQRSGN